MGRPRKEKPSDLEGYQNTVPFTPDIGIIQEAPVATIEIKGDPDASTKQGEYNVEIIRDYGTHLDPFYIPKKDPDFAYRYLRFDEKNLALKTGNLLFNRGGWQLCPREHSLRIGFKERELAPDGLRRVNDTVLAFMPKKLYEEKWAEKIKAAKAPMEIINRKIKKGDSELDGKIHDTMKGLQTAESLGMKS